MEAVVNADKNLQTVHSLPVHSMEKCEDGYSPTVSEVSCCGGEASDTKHGRNTDTEDFSSEKVLRSGMDKFKISSRMGPLEIPYERSFIHFGELFVIHHPATIEGKPSKYRWRCSHYKTGLAVNAKDDYDDTNECEEQAKAVMNKVGKETAMTKIAMYPVLNTGTIVTGSLFDEDDNG